MLGSLEVVRTKSAKTGKTFEAIRFTPEGGILPSFYVSFDRLLMYRMADMEGTAFSEYVVDEEE